MQNDSVLEICTIPIVNRTALYSLQFVKKVDLMLRVLNTILKRWEKGRFKDQLDF